MLLSLNCHEWKWLLMLLAHHVTLKPNRATCAWALLFAFSTFYLKCLKLWFHNLAANLISSNKCLVAHVQKSYVFSWKSFPFSYWLNYLSHVEMDFNLNVKCTTSHLASTNQKIHWFWATKKLICEGFVYTCLGHTYIDMLPLVAQCFHHTFSALSTFG